MQGKQTMIKILAIDDNRDNLITLQAMISDAFPEALFISSTDGLEGIELAISNDPDVILLDILMPGIDGFEICRKMKADKRVNDVPVVFVTALRDDKNNRIRALDSGAEAFLSKPIDESELVAQIRAMVKIKNANIEKRDENKRLSRIVLERTQQLEKELSERKKAETSFIKSELKYRSFFENSIDAILLLTHNGNIYAANDAACKMFGYNEQEIIKLGRNNLVDLTDPRLPEFIERRKKMGKVRGELYFIRKDGSRFPTEISSVIFEDYSGEIKTNMIIRDITEQKKNENELREKNEFIQTILDNLPIGVILNKIREKTTIYMNKKFKEIYGWKTYEINSITDFFKKVYPDIKYQNNLFECIITDIESGDKARMHWEDIEVTRKDGTTRIVNMVNIPLYDQNTMVSTVIDITDLHNIQIDLTQAKEKAEESDRLKSAFLANMSHEIRTPMNSIMGFASLLPEEENKELMYNYAKTIVSSSEQLVHIIDDIVLYSKLQTRLLSCVSTQFDTIDLLIDVKQSFDLPEFKKGVELEIDFINDEHHIINSDYEKLRQIFTNLVSNSFKYTREGSIIMGIRRQKDIFLFSVKDSGIGIPVNEKNKIFDRFYRATNVNTGIISGTGLGLSIVKELVELLGGKIWVESELQKGCTFYFSIPVSHHSPMSN